MTVMGLKWHSDLRQKLSRLLVNDPLMLSLRDNFVTPGDGAVSKAVGLAGKRTDRNRRERPTMRKTIAAAVAVLALCALALPAAAATGAQPPPGMRFTGNTSLIHLAPVRLPATHLPHLAHARRLPSGQTLAPSSNWAGYADTACATCALRSVATQFTVPSINCTVPTASGEPYAGFWAGLDGYADATVEQTGVAATCLGSTPVYYAWYEMYPLTPVVLSITGFGPGDSVASASTSTRPRTSTSSRSTTSPRTPVLSPASRARPGPPAPTPAPR